MNKLNQRQKTLYEFLCHRANYSNEFVSKEEITNVLTGFYPRYLESSNEHNSAVFALIRRDVRAINFSDAEKIIVSNHEGYKIATREEALKYVKRKLASNLKGLKLYWNIKHKIDHNGQVDITFHEVKTFIGEATEGINNFGAATQSLALKLKNNE